MINQNSSKDYIGNCEYYINEKSGLLEEYKYPSSIGVVGTDDIIRVTGSSKLVRR